ncbi:hypothetical protein MMC17_006956 [Xylographa soralifera]|nr:hypothetical protein [Xylographa soralifera]
MVDAQVSLGTAAPFAVLAASAITSTGLTVLTGEMDIYPDTATSITGFPPGLSGTIHGADAVAQAAHNDAMTAYTTLAALTPTTVLTGQDLGGKTLVPDLFVFQFGSTITTATAATVVLINGAQACNVFWQVGSSATLGTGTKFVGTIIAEASITANSGVSCQGGLFALTAAVTMIDDAITAPSTCGKGAAPSSSSTVSTGAGASPTSTVAPRTVTITDTVTDTLTDTITNTVTQTVNGSGATKTVTSTDSITTTDYKTTTVSAKCTYSKVARYVM